MIDAARRGAREILAEERIETLLNGARTIRLRAEEKYGNNSVKRKAMIEAAALLEDMAADEEMPE